jgi:hypothetical protein
VVPVVAVLFVSSVLVPEGGVVVVFPAAVVVALPAVVVIVVVPLVTTTGAFELSVGLAGVLAPEVGLDWAMVKEVPAANRPAMAMIRIREFMDF